MRYVYKLTLGVQHVKSPIKLIHIPIRVIHADLGISLPVISSLANPFIANHNSGYAFLKFGNHLFVVFRLS